MAYFDDLVNFEAVINLIKIFNHLTPLIYIHTISYTISLLSQYYLNTALGDGYITLYHVH